MFGIEPYQDFFQVDTLPLDIDHYCEVEYTAQDPAKFKDVTVKLMLNWMKTNSPLWSYWAKIINENLKKEFDNYDLSERVNHISRHNKYFYFGLPIAETQSVCRTMMRNDVVKLTVQITEPSVMRIEKDVISTFTDQLGVIGNQILLVIVIPPGQFKFFTLGGTIGLFTGLSLISVVEALYWMIKVNLPSMTKQTMISYLFLLQAFIHMFNMKGTRKQ